MLPSPLTDTPNKGDPGSLSRQELEENLQHKRSICHRLERQLADLNGRCCALEQENHELTGGLKLARQMESHYASELDELERARKALADELKQANAVAAQAAAAAAAAASSTSVKTGPVSPAPTDSTSSGPGSSSARLSVPDSVATGQSAGSTGQQQQAASDPQLQALRSQLAELKAALSAARDAEEEAIRDRYQLEVAHKSELRQLAVRLAEAEEAAEAARAESSLLRERLAEREAEAEALVLAVDEQRLRAAAAENSGRPASANNIGADSTDGAAVSLAGSDACQMAERGNSLFAELEDRRVKAELRVVELQRGVNQLRDRLAKKDAEASEMRCLFAARMRERVRPAHNAQYVADLEQEAAWSRQQIEALQRKVQLLEVSQDANKLQSASVLRTFERTCGLGGSGSGRPTSATSSASSLLASASAAAAAHSHGVTLEARLAECQELLRSRELECCSLRNTKLEYSRQAAQLRAQLEASEQRLAELELQLIRQRHEEAEFSANLDASCLAAGPDATCQSVAAAADRTLLQTQSQPSTSYSTSTTLVASSSSSAASASATEAARQRLKLQMNYPPQLLEMMQRKQGNKNA